MVWFKFTEKHRHRQGARSFKVYPAGWEGSVTTACADEAEALGRGSRKKKPGGTRISKSGEAYQAEGSTFLTDPAPAPESKPDDGEG